MASELTSADVLKHLSLTENEQTIKEFSVAGLTPESLTSVQIKNTITILGITPEECIKECGTTEFNFEKLIETFKHYCKDFDAELEDGKPSKALQFALELIYEMGPYIRNEKKSKGDKGLRYRFPYTKKNNGDETLSIKVVIVSTFKEIPYKDMVQDNKMILTFKQAGLLAMMTFSKVARYA